MRLVRSAERSSTACHTQVQVGDVIYIEANSGSVKRVGRCDAYATEFDLEVRALLPRHIMSSDGL